jgi:hypothetical protein
VSEQLNYAPLISLLSMNIGSNRPVIDSKSSEQGHPMNDFVMVWGFGSNSIGRFSLVGLYYHATGWSVCTLTDLHFHL